MLIAIAATVTALAGAHLISVEGSTSSRPSVVSTSPASEAVVAPGHIDLSVTFDRSMRRRSYSFVQKSADTYPDCGNNEPKQSADGRTFTLKCEVKAGRHYEIWFNSPPYMNFVDETGVPAVPYRLRFRAK